MEGRQTKPNEAHDNQKASRTFVEGYRENMEDLKAQVDNMNLIIKVTGPVSYMSNLINGIARNSSDDYCSNEPEVEYSGIGPKLLPRIKSTAELSRPENLLQYSG